MTDRYVATSAAPGVDVDALSSPSSGSVTLPASVRDAVAWFDFETLPDTTDGTSIRTWVGLHGELARLYAGTAPTLNATAPASLDYSAAGGCQRVGELSISGAAPRSLAALITRGALYGKKWLVVWGYIYGIYLYGHTPQVEHGTGAVLDAGAAIDGERHLIVSTYNGSVGKLYVDGALVDTRTYGALTSTAQPLALAARGDAAYEPFNGRLHAAGAWDRALSAAEVAALHAWLTAR